MEKLTEKQDEELLKARAIFKKAVVKIGLNPDEWDLYHIAQIQGKRVEENLEQAKVEHQQAEQDVALSLKELINKQKDVNVVVRNQDPQELPYSEIMINKSSKVAGCRSNTATLKEVEAVMLKLNEKGLIDGSAPSYIG